MNQYDLNRAVAHATGETVSTVKRLGFLLADPLDFNESDNFSDESHGPEVIDWDELDFERHQRDAFNSFHYPVTV